MTNAIVIKKNIITSIIFSLSFLYVFNVQAMGDDSSLVSQTSTVSSEQPPEETENDLQVIVVTGTKTGKNVKEGPVKTELVLQKDIKDKRYRDVSEAILDIPGVNLVDISGKEGRSAVIQGLGGDHVLLLVDGVPVTQNANSGFDLTQISTADIQQIEVVKGGASALYGGKAMGGVINIITKKPSNKANYGVEILKDAMTEGDVKSDVGYNVLKGHYSKKNGDTSYKFSLANNKSSSIDLDESTLSRDTPDLNKFMGNLQVGQSLSARSNMYADINYYNEKNKSYSSKQKPDSSFKEVHNAAQIQSYRIKLGYDHKISDNSTLAVYGFHEQVTDEFSMEDDPSTAYDESLKESNMATQRIEMVLNSSVTDDHLLTTGLIVDRNSLDQKNTTANPASTHTNIEVDDKSAHTIEAFVQDDWMLPHDQEIVTGLRYTHDQYFGDNLAPKINYSKVFNLDNDITSTIRSSVGSGFRVPSLKERFYILDHRSFAGYIILGNDNLEPEKSISYQLGWELSKQNEYSFSANGFFNVVDGLIMTTEIDTGVPTERTYTYDNIDSAKVYGLELGGEYIFKNNLRLSQSLTYTRAENGNDGLIIPNRPFYLAQTSAKYTIQNPDIDIIYTFRFFGESYANTENTKRYDQYNYSDLKMNYHFNKDLSYFFGVKNLFDVTRDAQKDGVQEAFDQKPTQGRTLLLGVIYDV